MHKTVVLYATVMLGLRLESQSRHEFTCIRSLLVLSFLGRGLATVLFPIQGVVPNNMQQSWETVKIAGPGPHWPIVSQRWIRISNTMYIPLPAFRQFLLELAHVWFCVPWCGRYLLENLIGCPFVGQFPASFETQMLGTIIIHKPNECTLKLKKKWSCVALVLLITMFTLSCHWHLFSQRDQVPSHPFYYCHRVLSLCLPIISFLQGFLPKLCVHLSLPCGCIIWSLYHHCLKSWQLLKGKAITVLCLWVASMLEKYVWYHILFISKVAWMISKCHSMSYCLLYTEFHTWVGTCYREWVSFGSLLCSEEYGTCAFEPI